MKTTIHLDRHAPPSRARLSAATVRLGLAVSLVAAVLAIGLETALDVPAALTARAYTGTGGLVLEVVDSVLGRGGRFALDTTSSGATCEATTASAATSPTSFGRRAATSTGGSACRMSFPRPCPHRDVRTRAPGMVFRRVSRRAFGVLAHVR